jgi:DeoR family fructose operon transcriptional repressor
MFFSAEVFCAAFTAEQFRLKDLLTSSQSQSATDRIRIKSVWWPMLRLPTTECLAVYLRDKPGLLVVTNNLTLAGKIADSTTQTYLLGGKIRPATLSAVGAKTCEDLRELNAAVSFIGANGFSLEAGVTAFDTDEALVKKTMMANSRERILLVDSSKFGSTYPAKFSTFSGFDRIVTNVDVDASFTDALAGSGVQIALAQQ